MLLDVLGFILTAAFGGWLLGPVVRGIRTGRIHHTDSTCTYSLRRQPVRFWLVAIVFVLLAGMFLYVAFLRALAVWHHLSA